MKTTAKILTLCAFGLLMTTSCAYRYTACPQFAAKAKAVNAKDVEASSQKSDNKTSFWELPAKP